MRQRIISFIEITLREPVAEEDDLFDVAGSALKIAMLILACEDEWNLILEDNAVDNLVTVNDLVNLIEKEIAKVAA